MDLAVEICLAVIFLLLIYLLISIIISYRLVFKLGHPKRLPIKFNSKNPVSYKKFDFANKDGLLFKGLEVEPKYKAMGTILVCHYLGGSKELIYPYVDFLVDAGFRVICFDFRNHGESQSDKRIKFSLNDDFEAFFDCVRQKYGAVPIGVIGFSMGSTPALYSLANHPEVRAAVIDSGPLLLSKEYFLYVLKIKNIQNPAVKLSFLCIYLYYVGFSKMTKQTYKILNSIDNKPIFFIHGEKDNIVPLENAKKAVENAESPNVTLWVIPNSRHLTNRFIKRTEYEKRVVDFFSKNICEACGG